MATTQEAPFDFMALLKARIAEKRAKDAAWEKRVQEDPDFRDSQIAGSSPELRAMAKANTATRRGYAANLTGALAPDLADALIQQERGAELLRARKSGGIKSTFLTGPSGAASFGTPRTSILGA